MSVMEFPVQFIQWVRSCVTTPMFSVVFNGVLEGFFPVKRGLRLSPYLFLLVMEGFSSIFLYRARQQGFVFHPKCQSLNITHLIFADDLFVLCDANPESYHLIKKVLADFHLLFGLQPNTNKSSIFFAGIDDHLKQVLRGSPEGLLPVRYLGVPRISTRLKASDYEPSILLKNIPIKIYF